MEKTQITSTPNHRATMQPSDNSNTTHRREGAERGAAPLAETPLDAGRGHLEAMDRRRREPWPPTGSLARQMRAVLARMELVSAGTTQSYNSSGGGEGEQVLPATGEPNPPHLHWRRQFELAEDDDARRATIAAALEVLEQLTGRATRDSRPAAESDEDLDERIVAVGEGWSVKDTATHCRCLERRVVRARQASGRRVDDGKPLAGAAERTRLEKLAEAEQLRARNPGMTVRQIAMSVGLPKSTVGDHLGRVA